MTGSNLSKKVGQHTAKGTLITQSTIDAMKADAASIEVIQDNTQTVLAEMPKAIARALETIGLVAEGHAQGLCPVDTGRLRNSITHAIDGDEQAVYIGTNVEYAPYVELGTSKQDAQPFLTPAAQNHSDEYREILEKELGGS